MIVSQEFLYAWENADDEEMYDYLAGGQAAMNGEPFDEEKSVAWKKGYEAGK